MAITPPLYSGDPAPDFSCASTNNPAFHFYSAGGRYLILSFFGEASRPRSIKALEAFNGEFRDYFDDVRMTFFGISIDPEDKNQARVAQSIPGIRFFWDFERTVSKLYGALLHQQQADGTTLASYRPFTLVLDPNLRVLHSVPMQDAEEHNRQLREIFANLPALNDYAGVPIQAPVLIVPRVLEPDFCKHLIGLYNTHGGYESGSMSEKDGYTFGKIDHRIKKRKDYTIEDAEVREAMRRRIKRRLVPEIFKAFQFHISYVERYIVACYSAEDGGFFRPHRDNTTKGTAHRRFACTINLNAEDYDGGNLRFPEFGTRTYRAPTGGAVIFSCSLLHEATPVTKGTRYATLPFLYDEIGAKIREENLPYLSNERINMNPPSEPKTPTSESPAA